MGVAKGFAEVAGVGVTDALADDSDGQISGSEQDSGAVEAQSGEVGVGRCARDFFEEAREVKRREVGGGGQFFKREVFSETRVHQFDGAAHAAIHQPDAGEFQPLVAAHVSVAAQQMNNDLFNESGDD